MKKHIFITFALSTLVCGFVVGQDVARDGDAVMSEVGFFPDRGYYGASDTFTVGSTVKITNKSNNKSVQVYLVEKSDSFMELSYDAAFRIGLKRRGTVPVTVEVLRAGSVIKSDKASDAVSNQNKITTATKKSYQVLPEKKKASSNTKSVAKTKSAPITVAPAPKVSAQRSNTGSKIVKDKVAAVILAEEIDDFAAKYVSSNTTGKKLPQPAGTFYVQLGFFSSLSNAEKVAYSAETDLPVLIVCKDMETYMGYRVLAGPVELSERDYILSEFRDAGFDGAFAKINE